MVTIFHLLNKLKLPEARCLDEVGRMNDPNYYFFHKMVHHPTCRCMKLLVDLANVDVEIEEEDKELILLSSLPGEDNKMISL